MLQYDKGFVSAQRVVPQDWARLIRKLRWIGLTEEARRLEAAVSTVAPAERGNLEIEPFDTD
jgi:hypothetical protein